MSGESAVERAQRIKLIIFDVDGVLTDGSLFFGDDGEEYKAFNSRDGHGIKMLRATGVDAAIITGRTSQVVAHRARNLGIARIIQGSEDKLASYQHLLAEVGLKPEETAFMGDDVVDLPVMRRCGLAISVPEASPDVRCRAHLLTSLPGGHGAAREACEFIMRAQGSWAAQLALYDR
jgi:3-deoxy-D-manno-octulosonate 8-phosphate phosphatase (KDO 8-P phosphatase)